jgi:hypothetical protein
MEKPKDRLVSSRNRLNRLNRQQHPPPPGNKRRAKHRKGSPEGGDAPSDAMEGRLRRSEELADRVPDGTTVKPEVEGEGAIGPEVEDGTDANKALKSSKEKSKDMIEQPKT